MLFRSLKAGEADYYPWQTLYSSGVNNSSEAGLYFNVLGNENLKWETQKTWDIAVEFSFLSRLSGTIEYFNRNSDNLLFNVPVALSNGVTSIWQNLGKVRNSGVEIDLSYDYINRKDWYGTIGANMTYLKNKVVKMPAGLKEIVTTTNKVSEGHSIYEFYLRNYWGAKIGRAHV